ncbi:MAG: ribonuclease III [Firmicutes bacterium]|nr:ribonuclease III [Bacillota bacterium]
MTKGSIFTRIGYEFNDESLFETAVTHSSYTRENNMPQSSCNERLEFLGDAYLDIIISEELYSRLPEENEGVLTKFRALIVCGSSLAEVAREIELGRELKLGKGEEQAGGRGRESIIANAVEAVIAAIVMDGGYAKGREFVLEHFEKRISDVISGKVHSDYKTELQEYYQANGPVEISYELLDEEGPDSAGSVQLLLFFRFPFLGKLYVAHPIQIRLTT